ncbi:MAG: polyhydroxyalkanoate synthesis regulator DNA-binding domain-containing protein [Candidatus Binatia bacterium]
MNTAAKSPVRLIKRYGNRKLYDVEASRYVTLDAIRALVQAGEDVRVLDNDTGEDLTRLTFAQIIYEAEKKTGGSGTLSLPLLRRLVQFGDEAVRDLRRGVERGREALESVREGVQDLVARRGKTSPKTSSKKTGGPSLIEELLEAPQRTLDDLQQRIDAQVRQSVERVASHPALRTELKRVEQSLRQLEERLGRMGRRRPAKPKGKKK